MSAQRVALVSPYALSVFGGVQEQVLAMSRVLSDAGKDVLIVAPDAHDTATYDTPATIVRLGPRLSLPANGSKAPLTLSPLASRRAHATIASFRPDVVHFHEPFAPVLGWSTLWAHRFPSLGTFHRSGEGPAVQLTKPLLRQFAQKVDVAVAVSEAAAQTLQQACGLSSDVLFNGFELDRFVEGDRTRGETVLLFFVGRLESRKGVATAIDAVREHNVTSDTPWQLVIAGNGPQRGSLEARAAGDDEITFLGRIDDEEKRQWMRRAHVLLAPSTHGESFGLVILEGFASEIDVVASDIDGYRQAAGGYATLFRAGDDASLREAITKSLSLQSESRFDDARSYAEGWSMSALTTAYEERYERAIQHFQANK